MSIVWWRHHEVTKFIGSWSWWFVGYARCLKEIEQLKSELTKSVACDLSINETDLTFQVSTMGRCCPVSLVDPRLGGVFGGQRYTLPKRYTQQPNLTRLWLVCRLSLTRMLPSALFLYYIIIDLVIFYYEHWTQGWLALSVFRSTVYPVTFLVLKVLILFLLSNYTMNFSFLMTLTFPANLT